MFEEWLWRALAYKEFLKRGEEVQRQIKLSFEQRKIKLIFLLYCQDQKMCMMHIPYSSFT